MASSLRVKGYRGLMADLEKASREVRRDVLLELRRAAEPVRRDAERQGRFRITNIGPDWYRMRSRVIRAGIYIAPREHRRRVAMRQRRPNLARLLATRAMEPALARNAAEVERRLRRVLDRFAARFNRSR